MAKTRQAVVADLRTAIDEGTSVLERIRIITKRLSLEGTATLFGTFTGLLGVSCAYGLSLAIPAVSLTLAGPIGLGIGISGGLLLFRGSSSAKLDRQMDDRRRGADYLIEQIKKLPKTAPQPVRDSLWVQYHNVVTGNNVDLPPPLQMPRLAAPAIADQSQTD